MSAEIERKFLLERLPTGLGGRDRVEIEQGYPAVGEEAEVRLRRAGDRLTLTVKRGSGEDREEIEVELGGEQFEALWPACGEVRLAKRRYLVPLGEGLTAEVDVYSGELAGLAVVEVEFPSRERSRAFHPPRWFGRELTGEDRLANRALARDGMPDGVHSADRSRSYRLRRKEEVAAGLTRVAAGRAEKALERLEGIEPGTERLAEAVHGARKDLKKLRSVVRLLREELGEERYREENRRYRDAGRELAESRDAEVKLETLEALRGGSRELPAAAHAWRQLLERERDEAASGSDAMAVVAAEERIAAGRDAIAEWGLEGDSWSLLAAGLHRAYKRGRKAMRRAQREPSEINLHRWRKRAKDLWYALRLLHGAWPEVLGATDAEAHRLTDLLGDHHDLAVLRGDLAGRRFDAESTAALRAAIDARQEQLVGEAIELGRRLYAESPRRFRRRLRGYWKIWRG